MIPDGILILNAVIGLMGIVIGVKMVQKELSVRKWLIIDFALLLGGGLAEYLVIM